MPDAIDRLAQIVPALVKCWRPPRGLLVLERVEATARLSLRQDGTVIGSPAVTFISADIPPRGRELLTRSIGDAIRSCTPLRLTDALGRSVAGRPFTIRFAYSGRKGRGA